MHRVSGAGSGLRIPSIHDALQEKPDSPWFDVHSCHFLHASVNRRRLKGVARDYMLSFHGVSLYVGATDPLDPKYLIQLKDAADKCEPALLSEHICVTAISRTYRGVIP